MHSGMEGDAFWHGGRCILAWRAMHSASHSPFCPRETNGLMLYTCLKMIRGPPEYREYPSSLNLFFAVQFKGNFGRTIAIYSLSPDRLECLFEARQQRVTAFLSYPLVSSANPHHSLPTSGRPFASSSTTNFVSIASSSTTEVSRAHAASLVEWSDGSPLAS